MCPFFFNQIDRNEFDTDHVALVRGDRPVAVRELERVVALGEEPRDELHVLDDLGHGRTDFGVLVPTPATKTLNLARQYNRYILKKKVGNIRLSQTDT